MSACQMASSRSIHQLIYEINHFCHFDASLALRGLYMILVMNWNWCYQGWIVQRIKAVRKCSLCFSGCCELTCRKEEGLQFPLIFIKAEWFYLLTCMKVIEVFLYIIRDKLLIDISPESNEFLLCSCPQWRSEDFSTWEGQSTEGSFLFMCASIWLFFAHIKCNCRVGVGKVMCCWLSPAQSIPIFYYSPINRGV